MKMRNNRFFQLGYIISLFFVFGIFVAAEDKPPQNNQPVEEDKQSGVSLNEKMGFRETPAPVKIIGYKIGKGEEGEWIKGLTIDVQNVSNKPVYYFRYAGLLKDEIAESDSHIPLVFNEELKQAAERERRPLENLGFKALLPGEKVEIKISQQRFEWIKSRLETKEISMPKKVDFHLQVAYYGDGSYWFGGTEFPRKSSKLMYKKELTNVIQQKSCGLAIRPQLLKASLLLKPFNAGFSFGCPENCNYNNCFAGCGRFTYEVCDFISFTCDACAEDFNYTLQSPFGDTKLKKLPEICPNDPFTRYDKCLIVSPCIDT